MAALSPLPPFAAFQSWCCSRCARPARSLYVYLRRLGAEPRGRVRSRGCRSRWAPTSSATSATRATLVAAPAAAAAAARGGGAPAPRQPRPRAAALAGARSRCCCWPARPRRRARAPRWLAAGSWWLVADAGARGRPPLPRVARGPGGGRAAGRPAARADAARWRGRPGAIVTGLATPAERRRCRARPASCSATSSHTPAPALALAALPLVTRQPPVRVLGLALLACARRCSGDAARWPRRARLPLVFDLTLCVLAGLSLSAQWRRAASRAGGGCARYFLVARLASAAALSVAAAALGPLPADARGRGRRAGAARSSCISR